MTTKTTKTTEARTLTTDDVDLNAMLDEAAIAMQRVSASGKDTRALGESERVALLASLSRALGLNPLVNGVQFLTLNGREVLYVTKHATDQIASRLCLQRETIAGPDIRDFGGTKLVFCQVRVTAPNGRSEVATATLPVADLVNVLMKAETKAKRRATLSIAGLGLLSEDEAETIPGASPAPTRGVAPHDIEALGVEQRSRRSTSSPSTPHDPETGEVIEAPPAPVETVPAIVDEVGRAAAECGDAADLAAMWRKHQGDLRAAGEHVTRTAWAKVAARCKALGIAPVEVTSLVKQADSVRAAPAQPAEDPDLAAALEQLKAAMDAAKLAADYAAASQAMPQHAARLWDCAAALAHRIPVAVDVLARMVVERGGTIPDGPEKGPSGPQGGRRGTGKAKGAGADAHGSAREGAANDGAAALDLTRVSDVAEGILSRHGGNAFALRASIRKHAAELRADDVAVLADALARVTPADEHGARLTREGAERIVRGLMGARRAA